MKPQTPQKSSRRKDVAPNRPGRKLVRFANMKGRTIEGIELDTSSDFHSISICFADKTELALILETGFMVRAEHIDMKTGDIRVVRRWREIRSTR